jgi:hypothetical protein
MGLSRLKPSKVLVVTSNCCNWAIAAGVGALTRLIEKPGGPPGGHDGRVWAKPGIEANGDRDFFETPR